MKRQKVRAVEDYFPNGWRGQVLVTLKDRQPEWVTINSSPLFQRPQEAIAWADRWANE